MGGLCFPTAAPAVDGSVAARTAASCKPVVSARSGLNSFLFVIVNCAMTCPGVSVSLRPLDGECHVSFVSVDVHF